MKFQSITITITFLKFQSITITITSVSTEIYYFSITSITLFTSLDTINYTYRILVTHELPDTLLEWLTVSLCI